MLNVQIDLSVARYNVSLWTDSGTYCQHEWKKKAATKTRGRWPLMLKAQLDDSIRCELRNTYLNRRSS